MSEPFDTHPFCHGTVRGSEDPRRSRSFEGRFGRMFRNLPPAEFSSRAASEVRPLSTNKLLSAKEGVLSEEGALKMLAGGMISPPRPATRAEEAISGKTLRGDVKATAAEKDSGIPAGYTYLGQFIGHDLTFDPVSSLQRDNDPEALVNYRTPRFDLDCVYARGADDDPFLYWADRVRMRLGRELTDGRNPTGHFDVPRPQEPDPRSPSADDSERALIGDPRNDENVIIAQLHALFLQFHNRVADYLKTKPPVGVEPALWEVQQMVRWHYQWVILYDYLPRIVEADTYHRVLPHVSGKVKTANKEKKAQARQMLPLDPKSNVIEHEPELKFYKSEYEAYIPVEFSGAAYRFGHSMVRQSYRLNHSDNGGIAGPFDIFRQNDSTMDLRGQRSFRQDWGIAWDLFFDLAGSVKPQRALLINTSLAKALGELPFASTRAMRSLPERNLIRGKSLGLPSGQTVAAVLGERPLSDAELELTTEPFLGNAPLWYYILKEAEIRAKGKTLGPVGSRIVMETFIGLLLEDGHSFLRQEPLWQPPSGRKFGMPEFIRIAHGSRPVAAP